MQNVKIVSVDIMRDQTESEADRRGSNMFVLQVQVSNSCSVLHTAHRSVWLQLSEDLLCSLLFHARAPNMRALNITSHTVLLR